MTTPPLPTLDQLAKQAESFVAQIAALQAMTYQPKSPIKANIYVWTSVGGGVIHLVDKVEDHTYHVSEPPIWCSVACARPATNDEIKTHLIAEAEKRGIRVGAEVKENLVKSGYGTAIQYTVDELMLIIPGAHYESMSVTEDTYRETIKRPFLSARRNSVSLRYKMPVDWIDAVVKKPLSITVDGQTYTPTFKEGYVEFGCARIANNVIVAAHELCVKGSHTGPDATHVLDYPNRSVTSIRIGKGDFSTELLKGLTDEIKTREAAKDDGYDYYVNTGGGLFDGANGAGYYLRVKRDTAHVTCVWAIREDGGSRWGYIPDTWHKLPNRAAAEALLRKTTP